MSGHGPCLRCLGLLSERELAEEAAQSGGYAGFGPAPQVVWSNGVLASTAVGVAVDLLTGWNRVAAPSPRLQYLGNTGVFHHLAGARGASVGNRHPPDGCVGAECNLV